MPFLLALHRVVERHVGTVLDVRHSFGDEAELKSLLHDAGFREVRSEVSSLPIRFD